MGSPFKNKAHFNINLRNRKVHLFLNQDDTSEGADHDKKFTTIFIFLLQNMGLITFGVKTDIPPVSKVDFPYLSNSGSFPKMEIGNISIPVPKLEI